MFSGAVLQVTYRQFLLAVHPKFDQMEETKIILELLAAASPAVRELHLTLSTIIKTVYLLLVLML